MFSALRLIARHLGTISDALQRIAAVLEHEEAPRQVDEVVFTHETPTKEV